MLFGWREYTTAIIKDLAQLSKCVPGQALAHVGVARAMPALRHATLYLAATPMATPAFATVATRFMEPTLHEAGTPDTFSDRSLDQAYTRLCRGTFCDLQAAELSQSPGPNLLSTQSRFESWWTAILSQNRFVSSGEDTKGFK